MSESLNPDRESIRRHLLIGTAAAGVLVGGLGGWAATTEISGAVVASGMLVVDTNVKKVQHPTGGIVGELRVKDGDRIRSGEILLRLDETQTRANHTIITRNLDELTARQARLQAERDGNAEISFPAELLSRMWDSEVDGLVNGERKLFTIRRDARGGQISQLRERASQLNEQIRGLNDQITAKEREIELIGQELRGVRELWQKNLVQVNRVTALERDNARLEGERGALIANAAQTKAKITEIEYQVIQVDQEMRREVGAELADARAKSAELTERRISAEDQLKRVDLRAPQDGVVHQLAVHTVGGVITPGEAIMLIVPQGDDLMVESRIPPQSIDQLSLGQAATLRFTTFNQRTTPEITGRVTRISADSSHDQKTGASFYTVRIGLNASEIRKLGTHRLVPGMPVEVFIQSDERTVLSYLLKPLHDQIRRAFRES